MRIHLALRALFASGPANIASRTRIKCHLRRGTMAHNSVPQPNERLMRVFETEQESEAMVVRGLLESVGIDAEFGDSENASDVLHVGAVGVLVREEDGEEARQLIEEYRRSPGQEGTEDSGLDEAAMESASEDQASEE